jgi:AraC family cel operon transcriptional repressor
VLFESQPIAIYKKVFYHRDMIIDNIDDYLTTEEFPIGFELSSYYPDGDGLLHTHSFFEIFYMVSGSAVHYVQDKDGVMNTTPLITGDMVFIKPGIAHHFTKSNNSEYTHRDIVIRTSAFKNACDFISPTLFDIFINSNTPIQVNIALEKINQFEHSIKLMNQLLPSKVAQKSSLVKTFLVALLDCFLTSDIETYFNKFPTWFNNLLSDFNKVEFMQAGLEQITSRCHYDKKYLCHVFKRYTGVTMTDYLNNIRLNYALNLLQNSNKTISAIAQYLGFSSISYFNVIFKEKFGVTPKEIRKSKRR